MQQKYCLSDYFRNYKRIAAEIYYMFLKQEQKLIGEPKAVPKVFIRNGTGESRLYTETGILLKSWRCSMDCQAVR